MVILSIASPTPLMSVLLEKQEEKSYPRLDGVAASTGAACHSGSVELSPVLKAMGISPEVGMGAIRFSLGRTTTIQELERVVYLLKDVPLLLAQ